MKAEKLNKRVTIKGIDRSTRNSFNEVVTSETTVATVWASVSPISERERLQGQQVGSEKTHRVEIRYRDDVATDNTLVYDGRTFRIVGIVNPNEGREKLVIDCIETV
jgi:SPP1 family predicted phage head-tail adaptor